MAKALRTGRKHIPIHPVRVYHTKPQPAATPLAEKPRRRGKLSQDEKVKKALRALTRAGYNQDEPEIARLERKLDRLLR